MPRAASQNLKITLEPIARTNKRTLENLFQLYVHDFTELWAGEDRGDIGEEGLFEGDTLDLLWDDPEASHFLIRNGRALAGFAIVNTYAHSGRLLDWSVAEFFVLRKHRKAGVGCSAAHALFARFPAGSWEAAIALKNVAALRFWRGAIQSYPNAADITERAGDGERWTGQIIRFRTI